ncbi:MAG: imidazole glycerol phosphate synthase subunit HisH [Gaiellaceae bacterium]
MTVAIVDYGLGNLRSVAGAVERLGHTPVVTHDPSELAKADRLILPGVGAFGDGMRNLNERGLVEPLTRLVKDERKPLLGLCLGMQLLLNESEEFGRHRGLGWIEGVVRRIPQNGIRVPHVGWNDLQRTGESPLFADLRDEALFYYVHSYWVDPADATVVKGICDYGRPLPAVIEDGNVFGTQFHPEKSQLDGLTLLRNFLALS